MKLANELRSDQIAPTFELSSAVLDLFAAAFSEQLDCESSVRPETRRHALIPLGPGGLVALLPALPCDLRHVTAGVPVGKDHPGLTPTRPR